VVDAYLKMGPEAHPHVTFMWLSDPDHTAHEFGMGTPETVQALRLVDAQVGRIVDAHRNRDIETNVIVTSDHGFSTHIGGMNVSALLREHGLNEGVVTADGAVYVREGGEDRVGEIVRALQANDAAGSIFTASAEPGGTQGAVSGTLSFSLIHWDHPRAANILVSANWNDSVNEHGYKGATTQGGVAGHGTTSPFDIHATLIAAGPAFKSGVRSNVPTANTDIAPTICRILGIEAPSTMTGRVFTEGLAGGPDPSTLEVTSNTYEANTNGYRLELQESRVGEHRYVDWTRVTR
jgi:arylsulfatase A-like enzyme